MSEQRLNVGLKCFCACDCCVDAPKLRERAEKAEEELRHIKTYLGHYDQDANHAWMVRRIDAVLNGRDPGSVEGWTEHDAISRRTAFKDAVERAEKAELRAKALDEQAGLNDLALERAQIERDATVERAEKAEARVRELEEVIDQHVQSYQFDKERLQSYAKANPQPQSWPLVLEAKVNTTRCWRCKRDVPEDTTVCLPGVGTQCKDSSACRIAR